MKTLILICALALNAGAADLHYSLSPGVADGLYVNSPTESVAQTFTGTVAVTGNAFSVGGSTFVVASGSVGVNGVITGGSVMRVTGIGFTPSMTKKGILQIVDIINNIGLSFGTYTASPYPMFIQSADARQADNTTYPLAIQPLGGNVGINDTSPEATLEVNGQFRPQQVAAASIAALAPTAIGTLILCTNCTNPYTVCASTHASTAGSWIIAGSAGSGHCQ